MIKLLRCLINKQTEDGSLILQSHGYCSTCNQSADFLSKHTWLRDNFLCSNCGSIPRERALMQVVEQFYPNWMNLVIHETSPGNRGASVRLANECTSYIPSQFFQNQPLGTIHNGIRCENMESLTFSDECIDLHISQDVMEHIYNPEKAFQEIARTLKPGGAHIFTVPLVNKMKASKTRAKISKDGSVDYIEKPIYHGNPIDDQGSLVTMDWGYDIAQYIFQSSGLFTYILYIDDINKGIRAEYIEVLVSVKPLQDNSIKNV